MVFAKIFLLHLSVIYNYTLSMYLAMFKCVYQQYGSSSKAESNLRSLHWFININVIKVYWLELWRLTKYNLETFFVIAHLPRVYNTLRAV